MKTVNRNNFIGQSLLLLSTVIWGSSFVVLKNAIDSLPPIYVIAIRFLVSGLIVSVVFIKRIVKLPKGTLGRGVLLGVMLGLAYVTQTVGLKYISPGRNAFLTAIYCLLCPFFAWAIMKQKPKNYHVISVVISMAGIALITLSGDEGKSGFLGESLTLVCTIFNALHVVLISHFGEKKDDNACLLSIELLTVGVIAAAYSAIFELPQYGIGAYAVGKEQVFNVVYLTLVCTLVAQAFLMIGQKLAESPAQSAVILSLEAVFGVLFSVLFGYETINATLLTGFAVVFIAMLISELRIDVFKLFKKKKDPQKVADCGATVSDNGEERNETEK